jgi:hypothetical protein
MARTRKSKKSTLLRDGSIIAVLIAIIGTVFLGAGYMFMNRSKAPDKATLCPADGPVGHYVVLVDNTDPYNFIQREAFIQRLQNLADRDVPEGALLTVYALGENFADHANPVFQRCNPGSATGKSEFNANPKRIQKRYEKDYRQPLTEVAQSLLTEKPGNHSPIFEMLQLVSIKGFKSNNVNGPKRLYVFSDMLANTQEFSMFRTLPKFEDFKNSAYGNKSLTDFSGVSVQLSFLMNYHTKQTRAHVSFWEQYFEQTGGSLVAVDKVEG